MPASALLLALGSAVLHAAWNLLLARARDVQAAAASTFVVSVVVALPFALVWWRADASVWPYALASTLLEIVYVVALALAYRGGEVSFVYPLTRGLAPVLALVLGALVLDDAVSASAAASRRAATRARSCSSRRSRPRSPRTRWSTARGSSTRAR